jgi:hypothetical protein
VAGILERERRVLKMRFGVEISFFTEYFYHEIAEK